MNINVFTIHSCVTIQHQTCCEKSKLSKSRNIRTDFIMAATFLECKGFWCFSYYEIRWQLAIVLALMMSQEVSFVSVGRKNFFHECPGGDVPHDQHSLGVTAGRKEICVDDFVAVC